MTSDSLFPVLMLKAEIVGMKEAEDLVGRDSRTVRRWCGEFRIGHQSGKGAPWEISAPALVMVRHGDMEGLELLRGGDRSHPRVRRVLDFLGILSDGPKHQPMQTDVN